MRNFAIIIAILSLSSCGFYKRQYTGGWMLTHRHVSNNNKLVSDTPLSNVSAEVDNALPNIAQHAFVADTITPENQSTPNANVLPEKKEEEQDFYAPPREYKIDLDQSKKNYPEALANKTFERRVKNATRSMKMMFIGIGYTTLGAMLSLNGAITDELFAIMSIFGIMGSIVAFVIMFYSTYKSFEIINNNPDIKFNASARSQLIIPAVLCILFSGYIGLIFALILAFKNSRNKRK